ncbi:MAG: orotate phosphoribosyltransferase [Bacteroidales bacterium]|nr:orotate phosphoribosyltransferase [Bacteroidales bacterium]MDZ4204853.1 orotate phosphoribosyltransferase [Bacteroidales bacterium]
MKKNEDLALDTADFLLQIKAIKIDVGNPFTWTSGIKSPLYCDNRKTLSYPKIRTFIRQELVKLINEQFTPVDLIAGVATGAIAQGALVAQELGLPFAYVRSEKKAHGMLNQIEGVVAAGQSVVVVEDLVSTGRSSLKAVAALREAGCSVKGMVAIFSYGLNETLESFRKENVVLFSLTNYDALIEKALEREYIIESDLQTLSRWKEDPASWAI